MTWTDLRNNRVSEDVNLVADARAFEGMAGYPWIIMAANPQLSNADIERFLRYDSPEGSERTLSWIQRRRWMFREPPGGGGPRSNRDGQHARAARLMSENPNLSVRQLVYLLKEHGIKRGREWIRMHRVDGG